jgi:hypothetical protein
MRKWQEAKYGVGKYNNNEREWAKMFQGLLPFI